MPYLDFDLTISGGPGTYDVVARFETAEAREKATLALTDDETALLTTLAGPGIRAATKALGQRLFDEVFRSTVRDLYGRAQSAARQRTSKGVRIRLAVLAPDLAAIPWSLLYDPGTGNHVSLQLETPLTHTLPSLNPIEPITTPAPLKMLAMAANPADMPAIDVAAEKALLEAAIKKLVDTQRLSLTWIEPTWRSLQAALQTGEWHVFYFIGHGAFDPGNGEGYVVLCDRNGDSEPSYASDIGGLLANHAAMRLVHLSACEGAAGGASDIYASTAARILQRGVPAVLAMQRPVSTEAGGELTSVFYESLANSYPVDLAVIEARMAVRRYNSAEWATPALFLRAPDGALFELPASPSAEPAPRAGVAPTLPQRVPEAHKPLETLKQPVLRDQIAEFSREEMELLCLNLTARLQERGSREKVSLDDVPGSGRKVVAQQLIGWFERRGLLDLILEELRGW